MLELVKIFALSFQIHHYKIAIPTCCFEKSLSVSVVEYHNFLRTTISIIIEIVTQLQMQLLKDVSKRNKMRIKQHPDILLSLTKDIEYY